MKSIRSSWLIEALETRRLLTTALSLEISDPPRLIPGQEVRYTVLVTNEGLEAAHNATILNDASDVMEEISWVRRTMHKGQMDRDDMLAPFGLAIRGDENATHFARQMEGIGDINNDGFDDVLITSPTKDGAGEAFVVFGVAAELPLKEGIFTGTLDGTNGFRIRSLDLDRWWSSSLAGGGDVNGDGIDDFLIGSATASDAAGAVYVFYGKNGEFPAEVDAANLDGTTGITLHGSVVNGLRPRAGFSVDIAGDINADGIDDIVVGALGETDQTADADAVYLVFGGKDLPANFELERVNGENGFSIYEKARDADSIGEFVGEGVSAAGDLNGDGIDDVVFSSWNSPFPIVSENLPAYATVLYGSASPWEANVDARSISNESGFRFETSFTPHFGDFSGASQTGFVRGVGDTNGDGLDDVAIGSPRFSTNGAVHIVFGSTENVSGVLRPEDLNGENGFSIYADGESFPGFGSNIGGIGDFDNDGLKDFTVTPYSDDSLLILGRQTNPSFINTASIPDAIEIDAKSSIDAAGDFNNDGVDDILVRTQSQDGPLSVNVVFGRSRPPQPLEGQGPIQDVFDIDAQTTIAYEVWGKVRSDVTDTPLFVAEVNAEEDEFVENNTATASGNLRRELDLSLVAPVSVTTVGDGRTVELEFTVENNSSLTAVDTVIASNLDEVLVEAQWTRTVATSRIDDLMADVDGIELVNETGNAQDNYIGIGDFNDDGFDDLVDRNVILFGPSQTRIKFTAESPGSLIGTPAGDINGDGVPDVLFKNLTEAFIVYGSKSNDMDVRLNNLDAVNGFKLNTRRVASIGDVDGDGFNDLAVKPNSDVAGFLILYGSDTFGASVIVERLANTTRVVAPTKLPLKFAGMAGDVNADGYDDVLFGTEFGIGASIHLLRGGSERPAEIQLQQTSALIEGGGTAYHTPVGDMNGDGFDDLLLGFDGNDSSDTPIASLYIFFGAPHEQTEDLRSVRLLDSNYRIFQNVGVRALGDVNFDGFDDVAIGEERVIYGSSRAHEFVGSIRSHLEPKVEQMQQLRNVGDFNGDGQDDLLTGSFIRFGQVDLSASTGEGNIADVLDLQISSSVTYKITGELRPEVQPGDAVTEISVVAGESRTDVQPLNNIATVSLGTSADINGDGVVEFADFLILSANFGRANVTRSYGDLDNNGIVDFSDFLILSDAFVEIGSSA